MLLGFLMLKDSIFGILAPQEVEPVKIRPNPSFPFTNQHFLAIINPVRPVKVRSLFLIENQPFEPRKTDEKRNPSRNIRN